MMQKPEKNDKPWYLGTHLSVLSKSYPIYTNMTGFRCFSKSLILHPCPLDKISLSIGRVNITPSNISQDILIPEEYPQTVGLILAGITSLNGLILLERQSGFVERPMGNLVKGHWCFILSRYWMLKCNEGHQFYNINCLLMVF